MKLHLFFLFLTGHLEPPDQAPTPSFLHTAASQTFSTVTIRSLSYKDLNDFLRMLRVKALVLSDQKEPENQSTAFCTFFSPCSYQFLVFHLHLIHSGGVAVPST
jgi:hypothetical protein